MAHHVDARYDEQDGMFVPPIRTLGFNPQLKLNDSLLVQSYIEAYDMSYPEALRRIEGEVAELRAHLETEGSYELNGLGVLRLNDEGKLQFEPCEAGILTPELYGLSAFEMKLRSRQQVASAVPVQQLPEESAITIKMAWLRNVAAVAAACIAFLMIGTPVTNSNEMTTDVQQSAFINMSVHHRPAAQQADAPTEVPVQEAALEAVPEVEAPADMATLTDNNAFCIVLASQVSERNAQSFISQLEASGFGEARILVSGSKKVRRVVYGSYESEADAASTLHQLRSESRLFRESWIMEIK